MKLLTALVMTGALALGACKYDEHTTNGEHIRQVWRDNYSVTVTDQESHRIGGTLPRTVEITALESNMTPLKVKGYMDNALAPNATFTSGYIRYVSANQKDCYWGDQVVAPLCTAAEVSHAKQMLIKYSAIATQ